MSYDSTIVKEDKNDPSLQPTLYHRPIDREDIGKHNSTTVHLSSNESSNQQEYDVISTEIAEKVMKYEETPPLQSNSLMLQFHELESSVPNTPFQAHITAINTSPIESIKTSQTRKEHIQILPTKVVIDSNNTNNFLRDRNSKSNAASNDAMSQLNVDASSMHNAAGTDPPFTIFHHPQLMSNQSLTGSGVEHTHSTTVLSSNGRLSTLVKSSDHYISSQSNSRIVQKYISQFDAYTTSSVVMSMSNLPTPILFSSSNIAFRSSLQSHFTESIPSKSWTKQKPSTLTFRKFYSSEIVAPIMKSSSIQTLHSSAQFSTPQPLDTIESSSQGAPKSTTISENMNEPFATLEVPGFYSMTPFETSTRRYRIRKRNTPRSYKLSQMALSKLIGKNISPDLMEGIGFFHMNGTAVDEAGMLLPFESSTKLETHGKTSTLHLYRLHSKTLSIIDGQLLDTFSEMYSMSMSSDIVHTNTYQEIKPSTSLSTTVPSLHVTTALSSVDIPSYLGSTIDIAATIDSSVWASFPYISEITPELLSTKTVASAKTESRTTFIISSFPSRAFSYPVSEHYNSPSMSNNYKQSILSAIASTLRMNSEQDTNTRLETATIYKVNSQSLQTIVFQLQSSSNIKMKSESLHLPHSSMEQINMDQLKTESRYKSGITPVSTSTEDNTLKKQTTARPDITTVKGKTDDTTAPDLFRWNPFFFPGSGYLHGSDMTDLPPSETTTPRLTTTTTTSGYVFGPNYWDYFLMRHGFGGNFDADDTVTKDRQSVAAGTFITNDAFCHNCTHKCHSPLKHTADKLMFFTTSLLLIQ